MIRLLPALLLCGCLVDPGPGPEPEPDPVPGGLARAAMLEEIHQRADLADSVADRLESGRVTTAKQMADEFTDGTERIRGEAWRPVNEMWAREMGDQFDARRAADIWREQAREWRSIR